MMANYKKAFKQSMFYISNVDGRLEEEGFISFS